MNKSDKDEIIEEIRKIKYKIAEEHDFSVSRLVAYLKEKEKLNRIVISSKLPPGKCLTVRRGKKNRTRIMMRSGRTANMKKTVSEKQADDEMRPEYDFSGAVRGKYAKSLRENGYTVRIYHTDGTFSERRVLGEKTVIPDADVWEYFSSSDAVNNALRTLISLVPNKQAGSPST